MILTEGLFLGQGLHKATYIHPENFNLCVKVPFVANDAELKHELAYRKARQLKHLESSALTGYYGSVDTNIGKGYVFERIFDNETEKPSKTMEDIFNRENNKVIIGQKADIELIKYILKDLHMHIFDDKIITNDTTLFNFLIQYNGKSAWPCVRIIDNIGSPVAIPLLYYFDSLAQSHIRRYWQRLTNVIIARYPKLIQKEWLY